MDEKQDASYRHQMALSKEKENLIVIVQALHGSHYDGDPLSLQKPLNFLFLYSSFPQKTLHQLKAKDGGKNAAN